MADSSEPMELSAEQDAEIGREVYVRLQRLVDRLARRHNINAHTSTDYLLAGALLVASDRYDLDLPATREVVDVLVESLTRDSLKPETRH